MRFARSLLRAAMAAAALVLATAIAAVPASADTAPASPYFYAEQMGEDACTLFATKGDARFFTPRPPARGAVHVEGSLSVVRVSDICLAVENAPRQVEFTVFSYGRPVARHVEPFNSLRPSRGYSFTLETEHRIDYLAVAVCRADDSGEIRRPRCGEPAYVYPYGTTLAPADA
jgi:hypothetical protein